MNLAAFTYLLVPVAFLLMLKDYKKDSWIWLGMLVASGFLGIAQFVALVYIAVNFRKKHEQSDDKTERQQVIYRPDGSYVTYTPESTKDSPSAGKVAFRIIGGIIAGGALVFGLLFIGIILLFTLAPSIACGGSSKCM